MRVQRNTVGHNRCGRKETVDEKMVSLLGVYTHGICGSSGGIAIKNGNKRSVGFIPKLAF